MCVLLTVCTVKMIDIKKIKELRLGATLKKSYLGFICPEKMGPQKIRKFILKHQAIKIAYKRNV